MRGLPCPTSSLLRLSDLWADIGGFGKTLVDEAAVAAQPALPMIHLLQGCS